MSMERRLVQTPAPPAAHGCAGDTLWSVRAANAWHTRHRWHERAPVMRDLLGFLTTFYFLKHDRSSMRTREHRRSRAIYDPADRSVRECGRARRSNLVQADVAALKEDCVTRGRPSTADWIAAPPSSVVPAPSDLIASATGCSATVAQMPNRFGWRKEQSQLMKKSIARPR